MHCINRTEAIQLLRTTLNNPTADFRRGQWKAIDALVNHKQKLLVVQSTGWGKSVIYFMDIRILRAWAMGLTIIVSPLLALMRNQIELAKRFEVTAVTINSTNEKNWNATIKQILNDQVDCLLISPERLSNDRFIAQVLQPISKRISPVVVDEAHCISDWGHDFRPDYRGIVRTLRLLPANTLVLGTTATANDRVIKDIEAQMGGVHIQGGSLSRQSLALQNLVFKDKAFRLAWLAQTIPRLSGTGIIYTLTTRDAEQVSTWLRQNSINAKAYYANVTAPQFSDGDVYREHLEKMLLRNELKVLVATTALGMGFDKVDLSVVID